MPLFTTPEEYVAYKVNVQRVDEGGRTTYEVVDRFLVSGSRIIGSFDTDEEARAALEPIRQRRLNEVKASGPTYPDVVVNA